HVLQFMYETYPDEDKQWWIELSDVGVAAGSGHVDVVAWIFDFWIPAVVPYTDFVDFAVSEALTNATKHDQLAVVHAVASRKLTSHWFCICQIANEGADVLWDYVDADLHSDSVIDVVIMVVESRNVTFAQLERIFSKFTCLQVGHSGRDDALHESLTRTSDLFRLDCMRWLVERMEASAVSKIFRTGDCGSRASVMTLKEYGVDFVQFLNAHEVAFDQDFMLQVVTSSVEATETWNEWQAMRNSRDPSTLLAYCANKFFDILVGKEGSQVQVMSQCLERLAQAYPPRVDVLRKGYQWCQLMVENDQDRARLRAIERLVFEHASD
ncbi:hypothetical protein As57867_003631, partial [Aphanomyces stellatus]